jgi:hypothetical protein
MNRHILFLWQEIDEMYFSDRYRYRYVIFIFYQILIKENLSPNLESVTKN